MRFRKKIEPTLRRLKVVLLIVNVSASTALIHSENLPEESEKFVNDSAEA